MTLRLTPYLVMDGNAQEAIEFYERALGAKVLFKQTFGEMPENPEFPIPADVKERVSHAMLKVGETDLMFSDTFPGKPHQKGTRLPSALQLMKLKNQNKFMNLCKKAGKWICRCKKLSFHLVMVV